jgi:hypothetical protein
MDMLAIHNAIISPLLTTVFLGRLTHWRGSQLLQCWLPVFNHIFQTLEICLVALDWLPSLFDPFAIAIHQGGLLQLVSQ